jgi:Flp pilus assembly protein TadG
MRCQPRNRRHRGATLVEAALIYNVLFLVLLGTVIFGLGVFRYQAVSLLAREGARWASVHGAQYAQETGQAAATATDVYAQAIAPRIVGLDPNSLTYTVTWNASNRVYEMPIVNGTFAPTNNTVTVIINYLWIPEWCGWPVTLTSSSTVPMAF